MSLRALAPALALALALGVAMAADPDTAKKKVDHGSWTRLLERYVDDRGLVDYKTWKETDVASLDDYLQMLADLDERELDQNERLALWINAWNAITVRAVLGFHPIRSLKEHASDVPLKFNVWKDYKRTIVGRYVSLEEILNDVLRNMREPRIHFALTRAAFGGPFLRKEAYQGERIDAQLEEQVQAFFKDARQFHVEPSGKVVTLSQMLKLYRDDFGPSKRDLLDFLARHCADAETKSILADPETKVKYSEYDWRLDEAR
jgi:hypothetical protein